MFANKFLAGDVDFRCVQGDKDSNSSNTNSSSSNNNSNSNNR